MSVADALQRTHSFEHSNGYCDRCGLPDDEAADDPTDPSFFCSGGA